MEDDINPDYLNYQFYEQIQNPNFKYDITELNLTKNDNNSSLIKLLYKINKNEYFIDKNITYLSEFLNNTKPQDSINSELSIIDKIKLFIKNKIVYTYIKEKSYIHHTSLNYDLYNIFPDFKRIIIFFSQYKLKKYTFKELESERLPKKGELKTYNRESFYNNIELLFKEMFILDEAKSNKSNKFLIGIVGISGSGKTFALNKLVSNLKSCIEKNRLLPIYITFNGHMQFNDLIISIDFELNTRLIYSFINYCSHEFNIKFESFKFLCTYFDFFYRQTLEVIDYLLEITICEGVLLLVDEIVETQSYKDNIISRIGQILDSNKLNTAIVTSLDADILIKGATKNSSREVKLIYLESIKNIMLDLPSINLNLNNQLNVKYSVFQLTLTPKYCIEFLKILIKEPKKIIEYDQSITSLNDQINEICTRLLNLFDTIEDYADIFLAFLSKILTDPTVNSTKIIYKNYKLKDFIRLGMIVSLASITNSSNYTPIISEFMFRHSTDLYNNTIINSLKKLYLFDYNKMIWNQVFEDLIIHLDIIMRSFSRNNNKVNVLDNKDTSSHYFTYSFYFTKNNDIIGNKQADIPIIPQHMTCTFEQKPDERYLYHILKILEDSNSLHDFLSCKLIIKNVLEGYAYDYCLFNEIYNRTTYDFILTLVEIKSLLNKSKDYPSVVEIRKKYKSCETVYEHFLKSIQLNYSKQFDSSRICLQVVIFTMKGKEESKNNHTSLEDCKNLLLISFDDLQEKFYPLLGFRLEYLQESLK